MLHISKIARKPRGVAAECKAIFYSPTSIMLGLEGEEMQAQKKWKAAPHSFWGSTAVVLRLAKPWKGFGRIALTDGAFTFALYNHL